jgi:hypothetical protein
MEGISNENINALKSEHLRYGVKPIRGIIHDKSNLDRETQEMIEDYKKNADGVSEISECNDHDKWSKEPFLYCTGVIVSGIDKSTSKNISVMIHRNPGKFSDEEGDKIRENFLKKISESIKDIKEKSESETIDCVIFGGSKGDDVYEKSIETLSEVCSKELGFEPVVLTGPKMSRDRISSIERLQETDIFFDNKNRRLHIVRSIQDSEANESYLPSQLKDKLKPWIKK